MADIVLNRKDASGGKLQCMERAVLESVLQRLIEMKVQKVNLHAEWSEPPAFLGWLLEELHANNIFVTVCSNSLQDTSRIDQYIRPDMLKEFCLFRGEAAASDEDFTKVDGVKFFLPVDIISQDCSEYLKVIDRIPPYTEIMLGINWKTRLSGPLAMEETDHSAWADTIFALLDILSKKNIQSTIGCGVMSCIFTRQQLGQLPNRLLKWPIANCSQSYFYDFDGSLTPCMRLDLPEHLTFNQDTSLKDATIAFVEWLAPFTGHCMESDDFNCRSLKTKACNTGCIEHARSEWHSS